MPTEEERKREHAEVGDQIGSKRSCQEPKEELIRSDVSPQSPMNSSSSLSQYSSCTLSPPKSAIFTRSPSNPVERDSSPVSLESLSRPTRSRCSSNSTNRSPRSPCSPCSPSPERTPPYGDEPSFRLPSPMTPRSPSPEPTPAREDGFMEIPMRMLDLVFDRYDDTVHQIQRDLSCHVCICKEDTGLTRTVILNGTPKQINDAMTFIDGIIRGSKEFVPNFVVESEAECSKKISLKNQVISIDILIPDGASRILIKENGRTMRELRALTNCFLFIHDDYIQVCGLSEKVEIAKKLISDILTLVPSLLPTEPNSPPERSIIVVEIVIPSFLVGQVLGYHQRNVKEIFRMSGTRIQHTEMEEKQTTKLFLHGTTKEVEKGEKMVHEILNNIPKFEPETRPDRHEMTSVVKTRTFCNVRSWKGENVLGINRENIQTICNQSGASCYSVNPNLEEKEKKIIIEGIKEQVDVAKQLLRDMLDASYAIRSDNIWDQERTTDCVKIQSRRAGQLVGRNGDNIRSIGIISGAHCELSRHKERKDHVESDVILRGDSQQIENAKILLKPYTEKSDVNGATAYVSIPPSKYDEIIGKDGVNILPLCQRVNVWCRPGPVFVGYDDKVLMIQGSYDQVNYVKSMIEYAIGGKDSVIYHLTIPNYLSNLILGKRGETIKSLSYQSKAWIHIEQLQSSNSEKLILLRGSTEQVEKARDLIQKVLAEYPLAPLSASIPRENSLPISPQSGTPFNPYEKAQNEEKFKQSILALASCPPPPPPPTASLSSTLPTPNSRPAAEHPVVFQDQQAQLPLHHGNRNFSDSRTYSVSWGNFFNNHSGKYNDGHP